VEMIEGPWKGASFSFLTKLLLTKHRLTLSTDTGNEL
jgi:hypothetical protein